jgi:hypothetical protein
MSTSNWSSRCLALRMPTAAKSPTRHCRCRVHTMAVLSLLLCLICALRSVVWWLNLTCFLWSCYCCPTPVAAVMRRTCDLVNHLVNRNNLRHICFP